MATEFRPTHRIVFPAGEILVMLVPECGDGDGPAWTATEWDHGFDAPDWERDGGEWLFQGSAPAHLGDWYRVEPMAPTPKGRKAP